MKWNHLPVKGGIYDQHPIMLDDFMVIDGIKAQARKRQQEKQQRDMRNRSRR